MKDSLLPEPDEKSQRAGLVEGTRCSMVQAHW